VPAAFFVIGRHAERRPNVLERLTAWGHTIGNHTDSHAGLVALARSGGDVAGELSRADAVIRPFLNDDVVYFRPPYGSWGEPVAGLLNRDGRFADYVGPVQWDVLADDWACWRKGVSVEEAARRHVEAVERRGRGIVLLHDGADDPAQQPRHRTTELTKLLVPRLLDRGYRFLRLDDVPSVRAAAAATRSRFRRD
jgi:peptidoglycan/xylan/chitin deacetylase (PgdA/CDA1 family)